MEIFENDLILPGAVTEIISDYSSGYDTSLFNTTDSVVVLGTAFNGPVGKPMPIYSPEHAGYVFGQSYDAKTKREATLIPNIQDAWDRGCRTIYAVRISGKEIYKDYNLTVDADLKLRIAGIFPSNVNKELSMLLNVSGGNLFVKIHKPASRATINEKKQGLVDRKDSILTNTIDLTNMGLSADSSLVDLINKVNSYSHNNVLRLSIVDGNGNDVTISSLEAKSLKVKNAFSGLYTIGRDKTVCIPNTIVKVDIKDGEAIKSLELNSDVSAPYPIHGEKDILSKYLGIQMMSYLDFVTVPEAMDQVFKMDTIDYEEVELTDFDIYNRLGSGFAINAGLVEVSEINGVKKYRVKEVEDSKPFKKTEIKEGIYSMLENFNGKYRVLAGVSADAKIKNKLPKKEEFYKAVNFEGTMLNNAIKVETVVDEKDLSASKSYSLTFKHEEGMNIPAIDENLVTSVAKIVSPMTAKANEKVEYKEGSLFLDVEGTKKLHIVKDGVLKSLVENSISALDGTFVICGDTLYRCNGAIYEPATKAQTTLNQSSELYMSAMLENESFVVVKLIETPIAQASPMSLEETEAPTKKSKARSVSMTAESGTLKIEILGTMEQLLKTDDNILTSLTSCYEAKNEIVVKSPFFDELTVEEVVDALNEDKDFSKIFKLSLVDFEASSDLMDQTIEKAGQASLIEIAEDKKIGEDIHKTIPYRTDDNFARHLAQHCMYTSMKNAPTHGVIGTKVLLDTSITSISNRVKELSELRLDTTLVGKRSNGTDILDRNNMQYPIGRKVSVVFGQYVVNTDEGYSYVSNMAAGYAGMVSCLPLDQSSTCQAIRIPSPGFELNNYQLGILTQAGYVTTKQSYTKGFVITDGITMAPANSPYKRLSASRIADGIEGAIRSVCEPFIGKTNNLANQNSLRTAIKSELEKLKGKIIEDFDFKLITNKASNSLGIFDIDYSIIPVYEIKQIRNHITIKE